MSPTQDQDLYDLRIVLESELQALIHGDPVSPRLQAKLAQIQPPATIAHEAANAAAAVLLAYERGYRMSQAHHRSAAPAPALAPALGAPTGRGRRKK